MGKIRTMPSRIGTLAPKLGHSVGDAKAQDRARNDAAPWRSWYKTARWSKLRMQVLVRDAFTCQRTGVLLLGRHPAPNSPVANHKVPHRGDPALFWDIDNIEAVSKAYHDSEIQKQEQSVLVGRWD